MKYLHTMVRVSDLDRSLDFYVNKLGLEELRRMDSPQGRFTLVFLAAPGDSTAQVELTYNWDPEVYGEGRNFGHIAYEVDGIYEVCQRLMDAGVTINRPPRDGRMAFVRSPDNVSIELLQKGRPFRPRSHGPQCRTPANGKEYPVKSSDYTPAAKTLHWLIALLIFVLFPLGWVMDDLTGLQKFQAFNFHKSLGITVLALLILRVIWRFFNPVPELPASMPERQKMVAHGLHHLLYLTVFLITLAGWALISTSSKPSVLFQVTNFPLLPWLSDLPVDDKKAYHHLFEGAHGLLSWVLLALIVVHIAAALYHGFVLKDGILASMSPRFGKKPSGLAAMLLALGAGAFALGGAGKAVASEWSVKPEASQIGFEATGGGYTAKGTFAQYRAEIEFDPDAPEQTAVKVQLNMNSAAADTPDADQTLKSAEFFNPAQFPTAQYVARGAQAAGAGKYVLNGRLTLKGVTRPVSLPFLIDIKSGTARVSAETTINRLEFGVGQESVAGLAVDKDVKLSIQLTAVRLDN